MKHNASKKVFILHFFPAFPAKCFRLFSDIFREGISQLVLRVQTNFRRNFLLKNLKLYKIIRIWAKYFPNFDAKTFSPVLSKFFTWQTEILRLNSFFGFFSSFLGLWSKRFRDFERDIFSRGVKPAFLLSVVQFEEGFVLFEKIFRLFLECERNASGPLAEIFSAGLSKLHPMGPDQHFDEKNYHENFFSFQRFFDLVQNFSYVRQ